MSQPPPFVLPPEGRGARVRAVLAGAGRQRVAVALLALAALLGTGIVWARATPRLAGAPAGQGAVAPADQTLPRAAPDPPSTTGPGDRVAVHVAGRVRRPGLVRLPAGSRVHDAIRAAGGVTAGADLDAVNLARRLTDGEQVRIPGSRRPRPTPGPGRRRDPGCHPVRTPRPQHRHPRAARRPPRCRRGHRRPHPRLPLGPGVQPNRAEVAYPSLARTREPVSLGNVRSGH
jgi:competence protein ComEA